MAGLFLSSVHKQFDRTERRRQRSCQLSLEKILFVPDTHVPYHDETAWNLLLKAGRAFKPDTIIVMGDFADFFCVSDHDKNPNRVKSLDVEVADVNKALSQLDSLKASKKVFISGNHEDRLERYLMRRAPELFNMVRIRDLFKLSERGWDFVPYKDHYKLGKLYVTHDTGKAGQNAARSARDEFQHNALIGHTHSMEYSVKGDLTGDVHLGAMFGWLGSFENVDYMKRIVARRNWVHGFGIGHMEQDGCVHVQPIPIVRGRVVINGRLIQ